MTIPDVSILIPTHNGEAWIAQALDKIPAAMDGLAYETIVVDNASSDATPTIVQSRANVRIIRNMENLGFSRAVNQAAAASRATILAIINQDLFLTPGSLRTLHDFLCARTAVAGGSLRFSDGTPQASFGPDPTLLGVLLRLALPRTLRKRGFAPISIAETAPVDWVTGAFLGVTRSVFDQIGGFSDDFFMYYEDVDFCLRARAAGHPCYFLPSACAIHAAPHSIRSDVPVWLQKTIRKSQMTYFSKHRPAWESRVIRWLNRSYFLARGWDWP